MTTPMRSEASGDVRRHESFGLPAGSSLTPLLNIAFCIDENYGRCTGVLITSIVMNNPGLPLSFHIFTRSILPEDRKRIAEIANRYPILIHIYYIDVAAVQNLPAANHYSAAIYYRFLMPPILQGTVDRVLYLDSDIICLGNLSELARWDMGGAAVAAVEDVPRVAAEKKQELQLRHGHYCNSGVLLIDVNRWNEANLSAQMMNILAESNGKYSLFDQDALNLVLDGQVSLLPPIWNQVYDLGQMTHDPLPGTVFLHYTGGVKPWRLSGRHRLSAHYHKYEAASPWAGSPFLPPANYKEMEIYARLSLKAGDLLTALRWYGRYLREKLRNR